LRLTSVRYGFPQCGHGVFWLPVLGFAFASGVMAGIGLVSLYV